MKFIEYTATLNQRWDAISQANYQTPYLYEQIKRANPEVTDSLYMTQGRVLRVPVLFAEDVNTSAVNTANQLPPWKR